MSLSVAAGLVRRKSHLFSALAVLIGILGIVPAAATLQELQVGVEAPEFQLESLSGKTVRLSELRGEKLTAVVFWSTWSRKSEENLLKMKEMVESYGARGFSAGAINVDDQNFSAESLLKVRNTADAMSLNFPVMIDRGLATFRDYGVIAVPSTVILDAKGKIVYDLSGFPLVGAREMELLISNLIEGKKIEVEAEKGYQPNKTALRYYQLGRKSLKSGRMASMAEKYFLKAAESDSRFISPRLSLAAFYRDRNNLAAAREQLTKALECEPENSVALCRMGLLLVEAGETEKGIELLDRSLAGEDNYPICRAYLGYALGKTDRKKESVERFREAAEQNPRDAEIFLYEGKMHEEKEEVAQAAEAYRQSLERMIASE